MNADLISVDQARQHLLSYFSPLPPERVEVALALGRVLAEDILAGIDLPPFPNSSVDGFALRAAETGTASREHPRIFPLSADIPAGATTWPFIPAGKAARILTGAPLPAGADAVVPVEATDQTRTHTGTPLPAEVQVYVQVESGQNIRPSGMDVRKGELVLARGALIRPQEVAMLASLGQKSISAHQRPRVGILSTGDELVPPGAAIRPGQIYESNSLALSALVERAGGVPIPLGIAKDDLQEITARFDWALEEGVHLILSSAGVSVGAFDYVRAAIERNGELGFWRVNVRPGKPLAFGHYRHVPVLGLPGNPVSSFVAFELFGRPAVLALCGRASDSRLRLQATLAAALESDGRESYLRALVEQVGEHWLARLAGDQGSGVLSALVRANGLLVVPAGVRSLAAGSAVEVWLLGE